MVGVAVGETNATKERTRRVPRNSYRFALAIGFQPVVISNLLHGRYKAKGDPQRFLFAGVEHPSVVDDPPPFPEPICLPLAGIPKTAVVELDVDPDVLRIIRRYRAAKARGEIKEDGLDAHRHLTVLKVAALLSALESDGSVTPAVWADAWEIVENSRAVRTWILELTAGEQAAKEAAEEANVIGKSIRRVEALEEARETRQLKNAAGSMVRFAMREGRPVNRGELTTSVSGEYRKTGTVVDAIHYAVTVGTKDGRLQRLDNGAYEYVR